MKADIQAYQALESRFRRVGILRSIAGTLSWDAATIMPVGARAVRGEQLSIIEETASEVLKATETRDLIDEAFENQNALNPWQRANLREIHREALHSSAVPSGLAASLTQAQTRCEGVWIDARKTNDFESVLPLADQVLALTRKVGVAKGEALGCTPHEALMDYWDPGLRAKTLDPLFDQLSAELPGLIEQASLIQPEQLPPIPEVSATAQMAICEELADLLGYDRAHGAIAQSAQACFMDDSPDDVRITANVSEADYRNATIGITHEIGHSFYENGVPQEWRYQAVGRPASASFQESQSLLFEKIIMRSNIFADRLSGFFGKHAPGAAKQLIPSTITTQIQYIARGPNRVEADEATYPLHIVIRYRLEKALLEGQLAFSDLPDAWDAAYQEVLGIAPSPGSVGCLKDIHWYRGLYGYFQSYALGSVIAAQVYERAVQSDPAISAELYSGNVTLLKSWLKENLYALGRLYEPDELIKTVTGKPLKADAFLQHLRRRYTLPKRAVATR